MKALRVHLRGWTSSFRIPAFAVGLHPTLPLPPLSTLYGLISAAKGEPVTPDDCALGFVFESDGEAYDLEMTYELSGNLAASTNVITRQILYEPNLWLYLSDLSLRESFRRPQHSLLLGRSTELVQVMAVDEVQLEMQSGARLGKTLVPFPQTRIGGTLQALPTHFTSDFPRQAVGVRPWLLVERFENFPEPLPVDAENNWAVWMHDPNSIF